MQQWASSTFSAHILQLCSVLTVRLPSANTNTLREMFDSLSLVLASCVLLDCSRLQTGRLNDLFARYEPVSDGFWPDYRELYCLCAYIGPDESRICCLTRARHLAKGHQNEHGVFATVDFVLALGEDFVEFWRQQLRSAFWELCGVFESKRAPVTGATTDLARAGIEAERMIAFRDHLRVVDHFYYLVGPATQAVSHETCFLA